MGLKLILIKILKCKFHFSSAYLKIYKIYPLFPDFSFCNYATLAVKFVICNFHIFHPFLQKSAKQSFLRFLKDAILACDLASAGEKNLGFILDTLLICSICSRQNKERRESAATISLADSPTKRNRMRLFTSSFEDSDSSSTEEISLEETLSQSKYLQLGMEISVIFTQITCANSFFYSFI